MHKLACSMVALLLAACASPPAPVAIAVAPAAMPAAPPEIAPTPLNAALSPAATLWHLRTGLNVAALACRGPDEAATVAGYNAMLAAHRATLAAAEAAYAAEYQTAGGDWRDRYDDDQTRLYNFWGQAHGRRAFCAEAAAVLTTLAAQSDAELASEAAPLLARLDRTLAPPRLAVDPAVLGGGAVRVAAR